MQPDGIRFVRPLLGYGRNQPAFIAPGHSHSGRFVPKRATRQRAGLNEEEQTVRLSPHDTLTERNAEAESKKYFVILQKGYTPLKSRELEELPRFRVMSWQPFQLPWSASLCLFK